jgi:YhcH/YjgK/YiaL family protein
MIFDNLDQMDRYLVLHPRFPVAFKFLKETKLTELASGKYEIDGNQVFALVDRAQGRTRAEAPLEAHRKYIDIQIVLSGSDEMGWKSISACQSPTQAFNPEKDILFFGDAPDAWIKVGAGQFAIFFPADAHAPLVGSGKIFKIVIKVLLA